MNGDVIASKYVHLSTISRDLPMPFVSYYAAIIVMPHPPRLGLGGAREGI